MDDKLDYLHKDISKTAKKGYPILLSGSIIFLILTFMPLAFPIRTVHLIWVWGLMSIFPLGLLLGKFLKIDLFAQKNPLSHLGAMIAAPQAFFIPVFIIVYMNIPEYLPFTIGLLGGSHFLPYMWIYQSKGYLIVTLGTCLSSFVIGGYFIDYAFTYVPLAISISFAVGVLQIVRENKQLTLGL